MAVDRVARRATTKYWLSTLPADIPFDRLVDLAKLRWRIERDYQELKQEVGLGHFEGRGWRGFHHHATLCIAAYGFPICERQTIPPSGLGAAKGLPPPAVPRGDRPRGATAAARTPRARFDRDNAPATDHGARHRTPTMSMLRRSGQTAGKAKFMTQ
jgi:Transposase DDE domain